MLDPGPRRAAFATLAVLALLALLVAVVAVLAPLKGVQWWLIGCLGALVLVLAAEVVLLVLDRQSADDEVYDFVIEADEAR